MANNSNVTPKIAKAYLDSGLSVIPIKPDGSKAPPISWKPFQTQLATDTELGQWFSSDNGLAVICGQISGNLEILDIDAPELFEPFCELLREISPDLIERLPIVKTPSPGYQIYYRCNDIEGNQKLSVRQIEDANGKLKDDVLFETRGEGGYVVAPPSPAACHPANRPYEMIQGDITQIPDITSEEREFLLNCARSFDEKAVQQERTQEDKAPKSNLTRPGDDFNAKFTLSDWSELLTKHGWKKITRRGEEEYWQKPGKRGKGISATLNHKGSNLLYVFSTSAYPLEEKRAYTPFAAYTLLEQNGDFKRAAVALANQGYGEKSNLPVVFTKSSLVVENDESLAEKVIDGVPYDDYLVQAPLSDTGNAECFAIECDGAFKYIKTNKTWYVWNGIVWQEDQLNKVDGAILRTIRNRQHSITDEDKYYAEKGKVLNQLVKCEDVMKRLYTRQAAEWLPQFATTIDQYDKDLYLAATLNGTLNLQDGNFYTSRPEDYLTKQLGAQYDPNADCPRWKQFLKEVFNNDDEMIDFIQRVIGYSLTGDISEQVMFILYGYGKNGKGVFINTISALLKDYAAATTFKTFDADKRNEQTNDLAALKGKRFVAMSESGADKRLNEPLIKQATGGDKMSCRFLHKEFFEYTPQFKLFLATNHRPIITQSDFGIWRRIVLIPFTQNFDGREDKYLENTLIQSELPGILNWAIEGLKKWQQEGLKHKPKAIAEATAKYREDSDTIGQWLEMKTVKIQASDVKSSAAYQSYQSWAMENGYASVGNRTFKSSLEERGYFVQKRRDANYYQGFQLLDLAA